MHLRTHASRAVVVVVVTSAAAGCGSSRRAERPGAAPATEAATRPRPVRAPAPPAGPSVLLERHAHDAPTAVYLPVQLAAAGVTLRAERTAPAMEWAESPGY